MGTVTNVADLVLWDANNRVLRLADGTPDVNPKRPDAKYFRIRWNVTGRTQPFQILLAVDRVSIARAAHRELLNAMATGGLVGGDGWPVTGRRPQTGRRALHGVVAAVAPAASAEATGRHPHAQMSLLQYFDEVFVPAKRGKVKGNTLGDYRSLIKSVNAALVSGATATPITVADVTTAELLAAVSAAAATGGESRARQMVVVCSEIFEAASMDVPVLREDDPMVAVKRLLKRQVQPKVNKLDPDYVSPAVEQRAATYRDARSRIDFWGFVREVLPHIPDFYKGHVAMRLMAGNRPCELANFVATDFHFDEMYVTATDSLTLQSPKHNNGVRLNQSALKARTVNDVRLIPLLDIPELLAPIRALIASASKRAAAREEMLLEGRGRPRSADVDQERWLQSELAFARQVHVFTTESGTPFDSSNFDLIFKKALAKAYPDPNDTRRALRFYDLRELAGSAMKAAGVSVEETALLLGHSERVHRENYTERRVSDVQRSAKQIAEHLLANQFAEPEGFDNVVAFPSTA